MLTNCDVIVFLPIYGEFAATRKPDSWRMIYKTYIFINNNFLSYKTWKQDQKISNTTVILLLWVKALFSPKNADFVQKDADISKIEEVLVLKRIFSETTYVCVLTYPISRF